MEEEKEKQGFTVTDRRINPDEEETKKTQNKDEPEQKEKEKQIPQQPESQPQAEPRSPTTERKLPPINFSTFVLSLHSSSLIAMGVMPDPYSNQTTKELELAKQNIDLLSMLEEKTKGNLTKEENDLIKNVLYDLRMKYVEMKNQQ